MHANTTSKKPNPRVKALAKAMVSLSQEEGSVNKDRLIGHGFSPSELEKYGNEAGAMAATMRGAEI